MRLSSMLRGGLYAVALAAPAAALGAGPSAEMLGNPCAGCHGTGGYSPGTIPSIYRMDKEDLIEEMHEFRSGEEEATVMGRIARGYSDEEIRKIAEFFAGASE